MTGTTCGDEPTEIYHPAASQLNGALYFGSSDL